MKHGNSAELSDKNANLYRRPPAMDKADFLSLVDGRDKPEFKPKFAEWLASHCTVNLVRRCFEEQPRQAVEQLREEIYPAPLRRLRKRISQELDPKRRQKLLRRVDREWPPTRLEPLTLELRNRSEALRKKHVDRLLKSLSALPAADQIHYLNQHLKRNHLLPPAEPAHRSVPVPKGYRKQLTNRPPRSIALSEVQDDYYESHPALNRHEDEWKRLMRDEEFGHALAKQMARPNIPGEAQALEEIGQALAAFPNLGENPKPVWAALCKCQREIGTGERKRFVRAIPIRELLKWGFGRSQKGIRSFATTALQQHLQLIDHIHLGRFKTMMRAGRLMRARIKQLAGSDHDLAKCYRQIHRAARYDPQVVGALQEFFFHGLPIAELRTRPALVVKLMPAFKKDVSLLGRFLFSKKSKGKLGFVPQAIEIDKPGSPFQRKLVMHQTWPERVRLKREGKKDAELAALVDELAGVPLEVIGKSGYSAAVERLRERQGLTYPR